MAMNYDELLELVLEYTGTKDGSEEGAYQKDGGDFDKSMKIKSYLETSERYSGKGAVSYMANRLHAHLKQDPDYKLVKHAKLKALDKEVSQWNKYTPPSGSDGWYVRKDVDRLYTRYTNKEYEIYGDLLDRMHDAEKKAREAIVVGKVSLAATVTSLAIIKCINLIKKKMSKKDAAPYLAELKKLEESANDIKKKYANGSISQKDADTKLAKLYAVMDNLGKKIEKSESNR